MPATTPLRTEGSPKERTTPMIFEQQDKKYFTNSANAAQSLPTRSGRNTLTLLPSPEEEETSEEEVDGQDGEELSLPFH